MVFGTRSSTWHQCGISWISGDCVKFVCDKCRMTGEVQILATSVLALDRDGRRSDATDMLFNQVDHWLDCIQFEKLDELLRQMADNAETMTRGLRRSILVCGGWASSTLPHYKTFYERAYATTAAQEGEDVAHRALSRFAVDV